MRRAALPLLALGFATGCSAQSSSPEPPLHSSDFATSQFKASFSAQSGDSNVKVYASLFAKNAQNVQKGVELDDGDTLTATVAGGAPITLEEVSGDGSASITYVATLPFATDAEDIFVALVRGGGKVSAPNTVIHLPAPFTMTSSATTGSIKFGDPVDVKVTPPPPPTTPLRLEAVGSCVASSGNESLAAPKFDANGNGTIDTNQIKMDRSSTCDLDLYLDEIGDPGVLDPAYAGGLIGFGDVQSEQRRDVKVTATP